MTLAAGSIALPVPSWLVPKHSQHRMQPGWWQVVRPADIGQWAAPQAPAPGAQLPATSLSSPGPSLCGVSGKASPAVCPPQVLAGPELESSFAMTAPSLSPCSFPASRQPAAHPVPWGGLEGVDGFAAAEQRATLPLPHAAAGSEPPSQGAISLRGLAGGLQGPGSTFTAGLDPGCRRGWKTTGVLAACLQRAGGSSAVVRGALPPAVVGSHRSACGHRAEAKAELPPLPSARPSAAMVAVKGEQSRAVCAASRV